MRIVLLIGHDENSPGAKNKEFKMNEFKFNSVIAKSIIKRMHELGFKYCKDIFVVFRTKKLTYKKIPEYVNGMKPDFIISMHCNSFDTTVSGSEVLYYEKSKKGKVIAGILQKEVLEALKLNDRGLKPLKSSENGGYLLKNTKAPCVICEPFFIDNDKDFVKAVLDSNKLINAYANAFIKIDFELSKK